jgi:uncharacterized protein (DUF1697 family)
MTTYVALLRGINLGNRHVKMATLAATFEEMGFGAVSTFIASGNVLFESVALDPGNLEEQIQLQLAVSLGYTVDTFVRTRTEIAAIAAFHAFPDADQEDPANTIHVGFLKAALEPEAAKRLEACRTDVDEFRARGREFYWLCRIRTSDSKVWASPAMRAVGIRTSSMRNMTMLRKLMAQYPAAESTRR